MIKLTYGKKGYWLGPHTLANSRAESFSEFSECNTAHSPVLLLSSFVVSPHSQPSWNAAKEEIKGLWMILCSVPLGFLVSGEAALPSAVAIIPLSLPLLPGFAF